jgi:hypothetical protein
MSEKIVAAAVNAYGAIWSLPRPNRHHHILWAIDGAGLCAIAPGPEAQGFLTSDGRFVNRIEGAQIAKNAEQYTALIAPPELYSEDLW